MARVKREEQESQEFRINTSTINFCAVGITPLIMNTYTAKASHELLLPKKKMGLAEREQTLKHNPPEEFRNSAYKWSDSGQHKDEPTRLYMPAPAFKGAMRNAALRFPGSSKTEIGQLTWVNGYGANVWGVPQLRMDMVRSAGMNRTPDVRTRACLADWAVQFTVNFVQPNIQAHQVTNLMASAGLLMGVGDWRQEKGSSNFGQFRVCDKDDSEFKSIVAHCGKKVQDAALREPSMFDEFTEELYEWWKEESGKRFGNNGAEQNGKPKRGRKAVAA